MPLVLAVREHRLQEYTYARMHVTKTRNRERAAGSGKRGTGNGERGTRNGERGTGNGEWKSGNE